MLKIPATMHTTKIGYTTPTEIEVDLDGDGFPHLTIGLSEGEPISERVILSLGNLVATLRNDPDQADVTNAGQHLGELVEQIVNSVDMHETSRALWPGEARALAAALWHYADEAERRR